MKPSFLLGMGLVVSCALASGCDSAATKKVEEKSKAGVEAVKSATKEGVKEVKEAAASAADMARDAVVKPIQELLPKIEDKIKGMSGDAKTKAAEKLEEVKKLLEEIGRASCREREEIEEVM